MQSSSMNVYYPYEHDELTTFIRAGMDRLHCINSGCDIAHGSSIERDIFMILLPSFETK